MSYVEFLPAPILQPYIDAYWMVKCDDAASWVHRIFPDSCIDIIFNLGEDFLADSGGFTMKNEGVYLVGTMTRYKDTVRVPGTFLLGIRFKPLGFPAFFRFDSLHEIAEKTIDFERELLPEIYRYDSTTFTRLNHFFCDRLSNRSRHLHPVLDDINNANDILSIEKISSRHFITSRQLERNFKKYLGISPKEYAGFIRFQHALKLVKNNKGKKSLLHIALDAGYYDHAHLANEVKKYAGINPSQL